MIFELDILILDQSIQLLERDMGLRKVKSEDEGGWSKLGWCICDEMGDEVGARQIHKKIT